MPYSYKKMASPVGTLTLVARDETALVAILWEHERPDRVPLNEMQLVDDSPILAETEHQLRDYFAGKRTRFDLPLDFQGTEFQTKVWHALTTIPFGETRSYSQIALQIDSPKAVRAVGAANGKNPLSIVVPCHRVIGASGSLTGFAGGLSAKQWLLRLERQNQTPDLLDTMESNSASTPSLPEKPAGTGN